MTVDRQWQTFKERMGDLQQLFIPVWRKNKVGRVAKPWLTREIRDRIRSKEEEYKLVRKNTRPEDWVQFRIHQRRPMDRVSLGGT